MGGKTLAAALKWRYSPGKRPVHDLQWVLCMCICTGGPSLLTFVVSRAVTKSKPCICVCTAKFLDTDTVHLCERDCTDVTLTSKRFGTKSIKCLLGALTLSLGIISGQAIAVHSYEVTYYVVMDLCCAWYFMLCV